MDSTMPEISAHTPHTHQPSPLQDTPPEIIRTIVQHAAGPPFGQLTHDNYLDRNKTLKTLMLLKPFHEAAFEELCRTLYIKGGAENAEGILGGLRRGEVAARKVRNIHLERDGRGGTPSANWVDLLARCRRLEWLWLTQLDVVGVPRDLFLHSPVLTTLVLDTSCIAPSSEADFRLPPSLRRLFLVSTLAFRNLLPHITPARLPHLKVLGFDFEVTQEHYVEPLLARAQEFDEQLDLLVLSLQEFPKDTSLTVERMKMPILWTFNSSRTYMRQVEWPSSTLKLRHLAIVGAGYHKPTVKLLDTPSLHQRGNLKRLYAPKKDLQWPYESAVAETSGTQATVATTSTTTIWEELMNWGAQYTVEIVDSDLHHRNYNTLHHVFSILDNVLAWERRQGVVRN